MLSEKTACDNTVLPKGARAQLYPSEQSQSPAHTVSQRPDPANDDSRNPQGQWFGDQQHGRGVFAHWAPEEGILVYEAGVLLLVFQSCTLQP